MRDRGFLVATFIEGPWWRRIVKIHITDGRQNIYFQNAGSFTIETDKPLIVPLLEVDK